MRAELAQVEKEKSVIVNTVLFLHSTWDGTICLTAPCALKKKDKGEIGAFSQTSAEISGICHHHCPA